MRLLEKTFVKNGLTYETLSRTSSIGLFGLWLSDAPKTETACAENARTHVGYEVSVIYKNKEWEIAGKKIEASESLTTNDQFGYDGSKAFFPHDKARAWKWYYELNLIESNKKSVNTSKLHLGKRSEARSRKSNG